MGKFQDNHREAPNVLLFVLRYCGLWSYSDASTKIRNVIYSIYSTSVTTLILLFTGTLLADLFSNFQNLLIVADDGCFLAGIFVIVFKHIIFHIRRKRIIELIDDIYGTIDVLAKSSDRGLTILVDITAYYDQVLTYGFGTLGGVLLIALLVLVPTENGSLPIRAKYPFNSTVSPMHNVAFAIEASAITAGVTAIVCMDALVVSFALFITVQLRILESNYRHCCTKWPRSSLCSSIKATGNAETEISSFIPFSLKEIHEVDDSFVKRFKICLENHQRLINIINDMNITFGSSLFCQLCASSSMICLTGFQVALGDQETATLIKFSLYCGIALSQLFSWCMVGNILLHQSLALADSPWLSGWEDEHYSEFASLTIFAMVRGQRRLELKAIRFYSLSIETFIMIVKASYSFFALLIAVTSKNRDGYI